MKRLGMRLGLAVAVCLVLTSFVSPIAAQTKSVVVQHRNADMRLQLNGDVQVIETWGVQFSGGPFTTAYRSIPLNKVDSINSWSVADETQSYQQVDKGSNKQPYTFEYTIGDGVMKATWFFPSTTDQTRTFKIGYTLQGALRIDPSGDEFYWKFIEADRQYPIAASRVVLHLPEGFKAGQLKATTYRNGTEQAGARVIDDRTIEFAGESFSSGTEWEIRAQFPPGVVKANPSAWQVAGQQRPAASPALDPAYLERFYREAAIRDLTLGAAAVAGLGAVIWLRRLNRRNAVKPARLAAILLIPGAVYIVASFLLGSLLWGSVCLVTFLGGFFTLLVSMISLPRIGGSTSWGGGGDWGGGDFGGGGGDGGGGGGGDSGFS